MKQGIQTINSGIYFLLEVCMLIALGYYGFQSSQYTFWKYSLAISFPLAAAILWGVFAAPRSSRRLAVAYRTVFALSLFGLTTFLLYQTGHTSLALIFGSTALISHSLTLLLKQ